MNLRLFSFLSISLILAGRVQAQPAIIAPESGAKRGNITATGNTSVSPVPVPGPPAVANQAWEALLRAQAEAKWTQDRRTRDQLKGEKTSRAQTLSQLAAEAKNFHQQYRDHPKAGAARKLEVTARVEGARLLDADLDAETIATAKSFRADGSQLREDRFQVAWAVEQHETSRRLRGSSPFQNPKEYELLADRLRAEFGDIAEVHALYSNLAGSVDMIAANRIATRLIEMRPAPAVMREVQSITSRYGLIGFPLSARLTASDGGRVELPLSVAPEPTIIYVWRPSGANAAGNPFSELSKQRKAINGGARWIYLGVNASLTQVGAVSHHAPYPGIHCADDPRTDGGLQRRLSVTSTPFVYVFDERGALTGFGRVEELPALLSARAR